MGFISNLIDRMVDKSLENIALLENRRALMIQRLPGNKQVDAMAIWQASYEIQYSRYSNKPDAIREKRAYNDANDSLNVYVRQYIKSNK